MPDFNYIRIFSKNYDKVLKKKKKIHGNSYCGSRADACGQRDGHGEDTTGDFCAYADAPTKK